MTNECNILIYSVFIFFCYSFIILNMALPLFHKDNPAKFTRAWFAWQNTLFGELILKLVNEGKLDLLNSIQ